MVITIIIILWLTIAFILALFLKRSQKVRAMAKILWRTKKIRIVLASFVVIIAAIAITYKTIPAVTHYQLDSRAIFEKYAQTVILKLQEQGAFLIDSTCDLRAPKPELAYALPAVLSVYNEIVQKPTTPHLVQLSDKMVFSFNGYKQFKNRSINIVKGVKNKLGPRYPMKMESFGENHQLTVYYKGDLWDNEQLCGLPTMEAAMREGVDPALLMSIIRHISGFDFNYVGDKREHGLLALETGIGLEQVFTGAKKLRLALDSSATTEDAVATLYPIHDLKGMNTEWRKSSLKSSWVKEVLNDVQFYRNNGLKLLNAN